jgi:AhpD family alkylhydroperoxidase
MSRLQVLPASDAGLLTRATYAYARRAVGRVPEPLAITAHHPRLLAGVCAMEFATERAKRVPERLKLLGEMKAAVRVGCEWCIDIGAFLADRHGVPAEQIREIVNHRDSAAFDDLERLVLDYAEGMTSTPVDVSDELVEQLREHLDPGQLVELTSVIALENYRARFNWALGIATQGFAGEACALPATANGREAART